MSYNNTSYSYNTSNGYPYPGLSSNGYPQQTYSNQNYTYPPTTASYSSYPTSTPMRQNASQGSYTSSSSDNSSNNYTSSYSTSPRGYSPTSPVGAQPYNFSFTTQSQYSALAPSQPVPASLPSKGSDKRSNAHPLPPFLQPAYTSLYAPLPSFPPPRPPLSLPLSTSPVIPDNPIPLSPHHPTKLTPTPAPHRSDKPTPYICIHPNCTRQFSRSFDLDRHVKTHFPHAVEKLDCQKGGPGGFCGRVGEKGFTRQDHLNEHLRKVHLMPIPKTARGKRD